MRVPDKLTCLKCVVESQEAVTSKVIVKFFKVCGISVAVDGSEDGEVAADAAEEIRQFTTEILGSQPDDEDGDPLLIQTNQIVMKMNWRQMNQ